MQPALEGLLRGVRTNKRMEQWYVPSGLGFPPLHCHSFLDFQKGSFLPWFSRLPSGFFRHAFAGLSCTLGDGWRALCPGWRETPGGEQQQYWGAASPQMALDLRSSSKGGKCIWGENPKMSGPCWLSSWIPATNRTVKGESNECQLLTYQRRKLRVFEM